MTSFTTRRNFVRGSLIAATAASVPALATLPAAAMPAGETPQGTALGAAPLKFGVASYTFRNFSRAQLIGFMKDLQLNELNCKDVKDHLPAEPAAEDAALADYRANGLHVHALGTLYFPKDEDAAVRANFEYAKRAGAKVIVAGDPAPETLPRIERFVKEYDIRMAIHNHGPEDKIWHSPLDVLKAVKNMDPRMGCCIDIGHCVRAGTDVVEAIHACGPRLFNVHAKDLTDFTSRDSQVAVGEGIMPIRKIFEALIATKYPGFVDLEYEIKGDNPMPGVIASFAYMRGVLAGMGYPTHDAIAKAS